MIKKVWGSTNQIFISNYAEVHYMEIDKGGYSSKHLHRFKHNNFYVISGRLKIQTFPGGDEVQETILETGQSFHLSPKVYHKFVALEDTKAIEVYWIPPAVVDTYDIDRTDSGGLIRQQED